MQSGALHHLPVLMAPAPAVQFLIYSTVLYYFVHDSVHVRSYVHVAHESRAATQYTCEVHLTAFSSFSSVQRLGCDR